MQLHELSDAVEDVVVPGRGGGHLLDDGSHVTEDGRVQQGCRGTETLVNDNPEQQ